MNGTRISRTKSPINAFDITMLKFRPYVVEGNTGRNIDLKSNLNRQTQLHIPVGP